MSDITIPDSEPDYAAIDIPPDKPTDEYTYVERRAAILEMILSRGHYTELPSQRQLGEHFDVSGTQIGKDIKRLRAWHSTSFGENLESELEVMKDKAVRYYLDEETGDGPAPHKAYYLLKNHFDMMVDSGHKGTNPDNETANELAKIWAKGLENEEYQNPLYHNDSDSEDEDRDVIDIEARVEDPEDED